MSSMLNNFTNQSSQAKEMNSSSENYYLFCDIKSKL